jgi:hypothetical protein
MRGLIGQFLHYRKLFCVISKRTNLAHSCSLPHACAAEAEQRLSPIAALLCNHHAIGSSCRPHELRPHRLARHRRAEAKAGMRALANAAASRVVLFDLDQ